LGLGAVTISVMTVAFLGLAKEQIAHSSVVTRTAQQIGGSFGTAVLAVLLSSAITAHHGNLVTGFDQAFWWATGFSAVAVLLSLWLPAAPRTPAASPRTPAAAPGMPAAAARMPAAAPASKQQQQATLPTENEPGRAASPQLARGEG
jgi:hypothetical protein